ncbi:hypothetical protein TcasGA2_TC014357 [Tribolium castaneum]|uniref:Uncharacterized protein n=1 Tax=Tribolium castaneum TaxID=7070 RepID=D6WLI4_TRICA|nr:hypothetical protein TcasGA2_TC014357 [Tribolium castaneum]
MSTPKRWRIILFLVDTKVIWLLSVRHRPITHLVSAHNPVSISLDARNISFPAAERSLVRGDDGRERGVPGGGCEGGGARQSDCLLSELVLVLKARRVCDMEMDRSAADVDVHVGLRSGFLLPRRSKLIIIYARIRVNLTFFCNDGNDEVVQEEVGLLSVVYGHIRYLQVKLDYLADFSTLRFGSHFRILRLKRRRRNTTRINPKSVHLDDTKTGK